MTESDIREILISIEEPVRKQNIIKLGMVKKIEILSTIVNVSIELPTPVYRYTEVLENRILEQLNNHKINNVHVSFTINTLRGNRGMASRIPEVRNIIAVAAGKGGVGKSTMASNLALALQAQGAKVGLLDADIYGPSMPTMLGEAESLPGKAEEGKISPALYYGMPMMSVGFFTEREGAVVWRGPMIHKLLKQFIEDVLWGALDYLVIDLPPGTGDAQLSLTELLPITGAVIVTTPQEVALIDVEKAISMFKKVNVPIVGIIENMAYHECTSCGHRDEIFSSKGGKKLAEKLNVPYLAEIPLVAEIRQGGDEGKPIVLEEKGKYAAIFKDIAFEVAESLVRSASVGPKRPPSLIQVS